MFYLQTEVIHPSTKQKFVIRTRNKVSKDILLFEHVYSETSIWFIRNDNRGICLDIKEDYKNESNAHTLALIEVLEGKFTQQ